MRIMPNKSILEGKVCSVHEAADGWGATVEVAVAHCSPAEGCQDFLQAEPGSTVTVFTADPHLVEAGRTYSLTTSVLGGPGGERVVVQDALATG